MTEGTKARQSHFTLRQAGSVRTVAPTRHDPHHHREVGAGPDVLSCAWVAANSQRINGEE
jgi:hypothetical protein